MFIPRETMEAVHLGTKMCKRGEECKRRRLSTTTAKLASGTELRYQDHILEKVYTFKYPGKII